MNRRELANQVGKGLRVFSIPYRVTNGRTVRCVDDRWILEAMEVEHMKLRNAETGQP